MPVLQPGFGLDAFGQPQLGLPAAPLPPRVRLEPIEARELDPGSKTFVVNEVGQYVGTTGLMQWVTMQLTLIRGSIASAPDLGNPSHDYPSLAGDHAEKVRTRILQRLNTRVAKRELKIHQLVVEVKGNATLIGLDVTDLTTGKRTGLQSY